MTSPKSPDEIAAEISQTRERILATVASIQEYAKPENVAGRGLEKAKSFFVTAEGKARPERIAIAAAAVVGLIGLLSRDRD
jgi:hypothetical protein